MGNLALRILLASGFVLYGFTFTGCPGGKTSGSLARYDVTPAPWASGVPTNTSVIIGLNQTLLYHSNSYEQYLVLEDLSTQEEVPGHVTYSQVTGTLKFTPQTPLKAKTRYRASFYPPALNDLDYSWDFTTGDLEDWDGPQLTGLSPSSGSTLLISNESNVNQNLSISMTFNETLDPTTISPETFLIMDQSTGIALQGEYGCAGNVCTFRPLLPLVPQHEYHIKIGAGIADLAGNGLSTTTDSLFLVYSSSL